MTDVLRPDQRTAPAGRRRGWPPRLDKIAFGGDYNAEQWPPEVWSQDRQLMRQAGVTVATVGVFSWALLEPEPGTYDFAWLDEVIDGLHEAGVRVCLATPTAAPPAWLAARHPESLPVTRDGVRLGIGARESFCPNSVHYRAAAVNIAQQLAYRYGEHPALALWHIGNEFGSHVGACYCAVCATMFIEWLQAAYSDLAELNDAWGTTFWGQRYGAWNEITPPHPAPMGVNPAQQLDYRRFSSDSHLACFIAERDAVRAITDAAPITTNLMVTACQNLDYWRWAPELDVVSNNHYLTAEAQSSYLGMSMSADVARGLSGGTPWLLMETSTSAVNWQPRNIAKVPGELRRNILTNIARGADGAMFFQWRASRFGAEKFHSAMLPQSGTRGRIWNEVVALGAELARLDEVRGTTVAADVALVWDWQSWWALELEYRPSADLGYHERVDAFYEALWRDHRTTDVVSPLGDLATYPLVVVPSLYLTTAEAASNLRLYVEGGGRLVVSYFSGIVDAHDTVHDGPYPGALRDVLGLWIDEFHPLRKDESVELDGGTAGRIWSESIIVDGAEVISRFTTGPDAGGPAVTRHRLGSGEAWYVATALDVAGLRALIAGALPTSALSPAPTGATTGAVAASDDLEVVRRAGADASYLFLINHGSESASVNASGIDLLTGRAHDSSVPVAAGDVVVLRERS
ncbi:MAG: beta-galactosidase [Mycobacteriales bacterium]